MDTKYINDLANKNIDKINEIADKTALELSNIIDGFEFENNDDLRLISDRINSIFKARFSFVYSIESIFKRMRSN